MHTLKPLALQAGLTPAQEQAFIYFLDLLRNFSLPTYDHSVRVGRYAYSIALHERHTDLLSPLLSGALHDVGKLHIPAQLLRPGTISPSEFNTIKDHTILGYNLLKSSFPLPAYVAGLHHRLRFDGYGLQLSVLDHLDAPYKHHILQTTRLVMLCDFFDAMRTRASDKGWLKDPDSQTEQFDLITSFFPESADRISFLFDNSIV